MYIYNHVHTYQMWVNEVFLDRRMTILHFFCILWLFLLIMGRSIIFHWFFVILTICFTIFHYFFQLYGTVESYNVTLVERHGFKKKRVPREKSGRHSNLIYLVLKPLLKNPGRHSVIFSISKMFFIIVQCFFILKMVFIDFIILKMLLIIVQWFFIIFKMFLIIFHWLFNVLTWFSSFFIDFSMF